MSLGWETKENIWLAATVLLYVVIIVGLVWGATSLIRWML